MGQSLLPLYSLRKNQSTPVDLALFFNDRSLRCYWISALLALWRRGLFNWSQFDDAAGRMCGLV
jgi:hypothetical protein